MARQKEETLDWVNVIVPEGKKQLYAYVQREGHKPTLRTLCYMLLDKGTVKSLACRGRLKATGGTPTQLNQSTNQSLVNHMTTRLIELVNQLPLTFLSTN